MKETIQHTKAGLMASANRVMHLLAVTPDERLNWSPSPTARTPLQVAAHIATGTAGVLLMLQGEPRLVGEFGKERNLTVEAQGEKAAIKYPFASVAEIDEAFHEHERKYRTREEIEMLLEESFGEFSAWLDTLTPEQFESTLDTYFGPVPMSFGITLPALHTQIHIGQLEYIQTIYGDMDRHP